eukprot:869731-Amphidinium_carterae.2
MEPSRPFTSHLSIMVPVPDQAVWDLQYWVCLECGLALKLPFAAQQRAAKGSTGACLWCDFILLNQTLSR